MILIQQGPNKTFVRCPGIKLKKKESDKSRQKQAKAGKSRQKGSQGKQKQSKSGQACRREDCAGKKVNWKSSRLREQEYVYWALLCITITTIALRWCRLLAANTDLNPFSLGLWIQYTTRWLPLVHISLNIYGLHRFS